MVLIKIIFGKKVIIEVMLFNFFLFFIYIVYMEKVDDKVKRDEDSFRYYK